jgi:hypothetical protein
MHKLTPEQIKLLDFYAGHGVLISGNYFKMRGEAIAEQTTILAQSDSFNMPTDPFITSEDEIVARILAHLAIASLYGAVLAARTIPVDMVVKDAEQEG